MPARNNPAERKYPMSAHRLARDIGRLTDTAGAVALNHGYPMIGDDLADWHDTPEDYLATLTRWRERVYGIQVALETLEQPYEWAADVYDAIREAADLQAALVDAVRREDR